jgi:hypothetical protein
LSEIFLKNQEEEDYVYLSSEDDLDGIIIEDLFKIISKLIRIK